MFQKVSHYLLTRLSQNLDGKWSINGVWIRVTFKMIISVGAEKNWLNLYSKRESDEINPSKKQHSIISYFGGSVEEAILSSFKIEPENSDEGWQ